MTLQELQDQGRRGLRIMSGIRSELEALRSLAAGAYVTTLVVLGFVAFIASLLGSFAGNFIFWSLR
jgi:hypothetical protein